MALEIDTTLLPLLPEYYQGVADYEAILDTEKTELDEVVDFIEAVYKNFFVQEMDADTATAWEQVLGLSSASDDLDFRRQRILNRISTRPPFTLPFLEQKLDELIGEGAWTLTVDYQNCELRIESAAESQGYATEVSYTVNQIKPAHIVYINVPVLNETLFVNETILMGGRTIKMARFSSFTGYGLSRISGDLSNRIAKVRLNGDYVISSNITKTQAGSLLTVVYSVAPQRTPISRIELLDSDDNAITRSDVFIPQSTSIVEMTHRILCQDGYREDV